MTFFPILDDFGLKARITFANISLRPADTLVKLVMQATAKKGFSVSAEYAERFLILNDNKILAARDAIETDLTKRTLSSFTCVVHTDRL
jgi:hypothetical protein